MSSIRKTTRASRVVAEPEDGGFPALESALAVSAAALFFQIFPSVWENAISLLAFVFSYLDVRGWTWRSYATYSTLAIVALVTLKAWRERDA